jgi:N-acetylglucosaminyldiphosphoundecaprenol N-acetyl-beta-D-mannosaminyltransferase
VTAYASENIVGYYVSRLTVDECVADICEIITGAEETAPCRWLACFNPHSYAESKKDVAFSEALQRADWLVPDGSGVVIASRILGGSIRARVTGSDVFRGLSEALDASGPASVFFLGSTEETLNKIRQRMSSEYPRVEVVGTYSPPFKPEYTEREVSEMLDSINSASPDVLWVGMTAPKQEKWLLENAHRLNVKFAAGVGAVFDFYAGSVKRSHPAFQQLHLEWLPRLLRQPRRLWRRMAISAPVFLLDVARQRLAFRMRRGP